ncbi:MAG: cobyric acid synthase [Desulfobulbaceae bacterium]|jgi:adenosylcobyric acid synthase|nr:cobyric acid synthase [Desulfobulbaceae bacterium]
MIDISKDPRRTEVTTPALMFQGTCSNAGKSILTAALCRIFLQDGLSVAPFKAQNMSLNSHVTRYGEEMGRAQVVQAQAARLDPDVRMNPVLLKPSSDTGSQVIVMGKPVANMSVGDYLRYKPELFGTVHGAYDSLALEHQVMVLEGAGSPAEVNLKHHDIVNMPMARYANAKVLLVGDIDRGGLFASFVGTMEILDEWERDLMAGFVVNRFRGQKSLLDDALTYTHAKTGKPVLGVIDYLANLGLPEEDSVSFKAGLFDQAQGAGAEIDLVLIDLPHISNFTDFEPFIAEPDGNIRLVRTPAELGRPSAILLPGSKNVIADAHFLQDSGLAQEIVQGAEGGVPIVGICGGFQLMGKAIADPHHIESNGESVQGLSLLDFTTVLAEEKTLTLKSGTHVESGCTIRGYEIHHGVTSGCGEPVLQFSSGESAGVRSPDGQIWGSYVHGIFDSDTFRRWFIDALRRKQGLAPLGQVQASYDLEPAFERLADAVREQLDMDQIYKILGL